MQPQYLILALVVGILIAEISTGRHRKVHRRQDFFMIGAVIASTQVTRIAMAWLTATIIGLLIPAYKGALAGSPIIPSFLTLLFLAEFLQYWIHRTAHNPVRHPILHGMHRTHHSAPYVNVTLMYRTNLVWPLVHSYTWIAAAGFYLGMIQATTIFYVTIMAWNALTHSDWRWDDAIIAHVPGGRHMITALEWILITPRIHHAHHGYGRDGTAYRNFCTMVSIYDRLFGTLHTPAQRPWRYGLPGGEHAWWRQLLYPLVPLGIARKRDH